MTGKDDRYSVTLIKPGILVRDRFGNILDARSNVTLIISKNVKIIVDTGLYSERESVINALSNLDLTPSDIDVLINTHSHSDHIGNNDLFKSAQFVGHVSEFSIKEGTTNHKLISEDTQLAPDLKLIETPGHTKGSISIIIKGVFHNDPNNAMRKIAITGDALPIRDNYLKWVPPGINYDPQVALQSMSKIIELAKTIIPGHDKPFEILKKEGNQNQAKYLF